MAQRTNEQNLTNEDLKFKNINYLKECYKKYIRNDFLKSFEGLHCKSMNDPFLNKVSKTYCCHQDINKEINFKYYELMMYVKNIITWLDSKMDHYDNGPTTKTINKDKICNHDEEHISRSCTLNKCVETLEKNELPHVIFPEHQKNDFSLMSDSKMRCHKSSNNFLINNSQQNTIFTDIQINNVAQDDNSENKNEESSTNNTAEDNIDPHDNSQNNNESLVNNPEEEVNQVSQDFAIDNSQDNTIFMDIQIKNLSYSENKNEEMSTNNVAKDNIDTNDNSKNNYEKSLINNPEEKINKIFKDFVIENSQDNSMKKSEENMDPDDSPMKNNEYLINNPEKDINEIFKNMENNISYFMETSIENIDSKDISNSNTNNENINTTIIINDIKEMTSMPKSSENIAMIEQKLDPVQSTCDSGNSENKLDVCLETSSKTDEKHFNCVSSLSDIKTKLPRKSKKMSKNSPTRKKRCNPAITDLEYIAKKTKMENLAVSHAAQNNHDVNNSLKASNDSTKKRDKNMYCRNSKGETKLHAACAKGKLDLVTLLLTNGFNPNVKDNAGWTPLHEAVKNGHYFIVKKLIDYGAFLNVPGFEYETPLYTAVKYGKFDIALMLFQNGADIKCINMYGINALSLNEEKCSQIIKCQVPCKPLETKYVYEYNEIIIFMFKISLKNAIVEKFCQQFNIKLIHNILSEKELKQVTHIVLPETENNTSDVNMEILIGIANGLFIVNQRWISDSLEKNKLMNCESYEISGITNFEDYNGPKISRISKQNLCPKLFDGICIYVSGNIGWDSFSLEQLKKLVLAFGAKLLTRMPNPENCPTNIIPYHCRNNKEMYYVSTIILYTMDSSRLIKYNMKHLKTFPISWFMKSVQEYTIL